MIRFLISLFITILTTTSAVVSANVIEVSNSCCCTEAVAAGQKAPAIQNDCYCTPLPNHKLPNRSPQVEIKPIAFDLQISPLLILPSSKQNRIKANIDRRRPLHLASNELYLKKRALLI